ncbi:MAG: hypothetical protein LGB78_00940 [Sulfurovum sp.]|nr:hypothetical protein [Sulfurovum sp.]
MRILYPIWTFLLMAASILHAESSFKYSYVPKKVYENQIFPITIIDTRTKKIPLHYQFEIGSDVYPLSAEPLVIKNGNYDFYTFYFKAAQSGEITLPRIFIDINGKSTILESHTIPVVTLKRRKDFCGVLAADMKIQNSQVSHYDEKNYLVMLSVEAHEANLEDMHLQKVEESGVEDIERQGAKAKGEFYVVIPTTQKKLSFTYFNTIKHQYVFLKTPVELFENSVIPQINLNPQEDNFDKLKKYIVIVLVGFFFLMLLIYQDFFYLILGTVSLITLLTFYVPKERICVKQGAPLYVLPTKTSDVSTEVDSKYTTPLLGKRLEFRKIEYKNGIIGWVKDEDLCKN